MSWSDRIVGDESIANLRNHHANGVMVVIDTSLCISPEGEKVSRDVPLREDGVNEQKSVELPRSNTSLRETTTVSAFFEEFKQESFEQLSDEQKIGILGYVEMKEKSR